jgi:hypothetical protein
MLYALYCNNKSLRIAKDMQGSETVAVYRVSGKREARAKALSLGAKPWNF